VLGLAFVLPVGVLVRWSIESIAGGDSLAPMLRQGINTLGIASLATAVCIACALLLAYAGRIARTRVVTSVSHAALIGYAIPGSVVAVGVLGVLAVADRALEGATSYVGVPPIPLLATSVIGLLFAYVVRFLAVAYLPVEAGLGRIAPALDESARGLGASPAGVLRSVHAPLMRGALAAAAVLVFVDVMKEMPATMLLRPFGFDTLSVGVWQATTESLWRQAAPSALAIVAIGSVFVFALARRTRIFGLTRSATVGGPRP
jgi:iron(III) transport system permease protein